MCYPDNLEVEERTTYEDMYLFLEVQGGKGTDPPLHSPEVTHSS